MSRRRVALAAALLTAVLARGAAAESQHLSYTVYFGYLPALSVATTVESGGGAYRVEAEVVPQSWISWAIPWTAKSAASGRLGSGVTPQRYLSAASWGTRGRQTTLEFGDDGTIKTTVEPPKKEDGRDPVPDAMLKGSLDPVSAVAAMLGAARAGGPGCAPDLPVFDGRRRFDIHSERRPDGTLAPATYSAYAGPTVVCQLHFRSLAGGYRDGERSRFWQTDQPGSPERPPIELHLAPLKEGALPVPVYVAGKSILGWVTAYLNSYTID